MRLRTSFEMLQWKMPLGVVVNPNNTDDVFIIYVRVALVVNILAIHQKNLIRDHGIITE
jgi:hypothetical protein